MRSLHLWSLLSLLGATIVAALLVGVPTVHAEPLAMVDGEPVHVEGTRLEVNLQTGRAVLEGDVRLRRGELVVQCERVEALYDKQPVVKWAKATGGVRAMMGNVEAVCKEAELALDRRELVLRGDVQLRRAGAWMKAKEALVDLKTQRITLENVRGSIPIPSQLPLALPLPTAGSSDK